MHVNGFPCMKTVCYPACSDKLGPISTLKSENPLALEDHEHSQLLGCITCARQVTLLYIIYTIYIVYGIYTGYTGIVSWSS